MNEEWQRVLPFEGVNNFRDYGGWRARDGARVATGALFRSAHHARATAGDAAWMRRLGIATVTDLRHPREQAVQPSAWLGTIELDVIEEADPDATDDGQEAPHMAAFRHSDFSPDSMRSFMTGHYGEMPYDARLVALYRRYFAALAASDGPVLIHCAAGKDRTGILAALTHHVLGVHPDDALEDYLLSNKAGNLAERLPFVRRSMEENYQRQIPDEALYALLSVEPGYLVRCRAALEERSGSIDRYLAETLGVGAAEREKICSRLLT